MAEAVALALVDILLNVSETVFVLPPTRACGAHPHRATRRSPPRTWAWLRRIRDPRAPAQHLIRDPLNVSYDASATVLDMTVALLKRAASTMCGDRRRDRARGPQLGRNFVRAHLPQLLVLWRNALPKPTSKDTVALDVARSTWRSASQRSCATRRRYREPLRGAPAAKRAEQEQAQRGLLLPAREALLRRRVHQCVAVLELSSITEATRVTLRQSCVTPLFTSPDGYAGAGNAVHAVLSGDEYARSVISIEAGGDHLEEDSRQIGEGRTEDLLDRDSVEIAIASNLEFAPGICSGSLRARSAVLVPGAGIQCEVSLGRTSASVHLGRGHGHRTLRAAAPFARLLPLQDLTSTVKILTLLLELPRAALFINAVAVVLALRHIMASTQPCGAKSAFGSAPVTTLLSPFLDDALVDRDLVLSAASSQSIGWLANVAGTTFFAGQIKLIVDYIGGE
ncbi:hypothetical protein B0H14DRAFT_3584124 [Mycena olivaceomarginata]|nr:hypothetical protein B0H14DRAFT_3584124 [Mycena olivaceomarginata]